MERRSPSGSARTTSGASTDLSELPTTTGGGFLGSRRPSICARLGTWRLATIDGDERISARSTTAAAVHVGRRPAKSVPALPGAPPRARRSRGRRGHRVRHRPIRDSDGVRLRESADSSTRRRCNDGCLWPSWIPDRHVAHRPCPGRDDDHIRLLPSDIGQPLRLDDPRGGLPAELGAASGRLGRTTLSTARSFCSIAARAACPAKATARHQRRWTGCRPGSTTRRRVPTCGRQAVAARFDSMSTRFAVLAWNRALLSGPVRHRWPGDWPTTSPTVDRRKRARARRLLTRARDGLSRIQSDQGSEPSLSRGEIAAMARPQVTVIGAGNVGASVAQRVAEGRARRRRADRYRRGPAAGQGARSRRGRARRGPRHEGHRHERLRRHCRLRHHRRHLRPRPPAGHEPRRPAGQERRHRPQRRPAGRRALARRDLHHRHQPARRDVPRRARGQRVHAAARHRHGRRPRHGPLPHVHRAGAGRQRQQHPRVRPRRPRRHDGAAAALLDRRRRADHRAA